MHHNLTVDKLVHLMVKEAIYIICSKTLQKCVVTNFISLGLNYFVPYHSLINTAHF